MTLPSFIIDEIRRREKKKEQQQEQPSLEIPPCFHPEPKPQNDQEPGIERGVIEFDLF
jgi:hypothetical protein